MAKVNGWAFTGNTTYLYLSGTSSTTISIGLGMSGMILARWLTCCGKQWHSLAWHILWPAEVPLRGTLCRVTGRGSSHMEVLEPFSQQHGLSVSTSRLSGTHDLHWSPIKIGASPGLLQQCTNSEVQFLLSWREMVN
jgi:hypothetical protein